MQVDEAIVVGSRGITDRARQRVHAGPPRVLDGWPGASWDGPQPASECAAFEDSSDRATNHPEHGQDEGEGGDPRQGQVLGLADRREEGIPNHDPERRDGNAGRQPRRDGGDQQSSRRSDAAGVASFSCSGLLGMASGVTCTHLGLTAMRQAGHGGGGAMTAGAVARGVRPVAGSRATGGQRRPVATYFAGARAVVRRLHE